MIRSAFAAIAALGLSVSAAAAQSNSLAPSQQVLPDVAFSTIQPLLQQAGATVKTVTMQGDSLLEVSFQGRTALLQNFCEPAQEGGRCTGLHATLLVPTETTLSAVDQFNKIQRPSRAVYLNNEMIALDRYYIADYGVVANTFLLDFSVLMRGVDSWWSFQDQRARSLTSVDDASSLARTVTFDPLLGQSRAQAPTNRPGSRAGAITAGDKFFEYTAEELLEALPGSVNKRP